MKRALFLLAAIPSLTLWGAEDLKINRDETAISFKSGGTEVLRYWLQKPAGSKLSVESGCFFHPFTTPSGVVMTEVGPEDHPHHRGIFLGWVEMHGKKDADFWGWGEHAPTKERVIVNQRVSSLRASNGRGAFTARNAWEAEGVTMLIEVISAAVEMNTNANILDLRYRLTPSEDITLSQWAFSGFCVRARKDGGITAYDPEGEVKLPNPVHTEPKSDWPDAPWYDYTLKLADGKVAGIAVINHPENPETLWHNHREVRMLNPCIVAPGKVELKKHAPLILRYRVVAHDGPADAALLNRLAEEWGKMK